MYRLHYHQVNRLTQPAKLSDVLCGIVALALFAGIGVMLAWRG